MENLSLDGKNALVTGGSSGIGAAVTRLLAKSGASVALTYHSNEGAAQRVLRELPGRGHFIERLSLEDTDTIRGLAKRLQSKVGKIDYLVNSAGFTKPIPHEDLDQLDEGAFEAILRANACGPYAVMRAMIPLLRKSSSQAVIVNVSSISAFTGSGSNIAYCAAKAALDTMSISLARVLGPQIRVLCVSPGAVATDFVEGRDRSSLEKGAATTPLCRVIEPEDVASSVLACITHLRASTGVRIVVDGGRHL